MQLSHLDMFTQWRRAQEVIDARLLATAAPGGRAASLVGELRFLWPRGAMSACVLAEGGQTWASALDESGASRPEWAERVHQEFARRQGVGMGHGQQAARATEAPLLQALGLTGFLLAWEEMRFDDQTHGALVLATPHSEEADAEAVRALLGACVQHLAVRLEIEGLERARAAAVEEASANAGMAEVGEASIPVAHDFNNYLNALLLHLSVLQLQLPEPMRQGLADLRRQALATAALTQELQHYRRRRQPVGAPVDLNQAVRAAAAAFEGEAVAVPIRLDLAVGRPTAFGISAELKRLCVFLIRNAAGAAACNGGSVIVRTLREAEKSILRVEDSGPPISPEALPYLFEPAATGREGTSALELAACKTLARRLQGSIRAENQPERGAAVVVEWPAA